MSARIFLDTNILIYLLEGKHAAAGETLSALELQANQKADIALTLLEYNDVVIGVQVLNEICSVVLRRKFDWSKCRMLLDTLEALCVAVIPLTLGIHKKGLALRERYQLQLYDAMLLAAALEADADTFYSEDMQHGQLIENRLTIKNPFKSGG